MYCICLPPCRAHRGLSRGIYKQESLANTNVKRATAVHVLRRLAQR